MPWNSPGNNDQDPWNRNNKDQGPPDLDEVLQKLSRKFGGLFGGKGGGASGPAGPGGSGNAALGIGMLVAIVVAVLWLASSFYIVKEGQQAVVLQFGKYHTSTDPGWHWHIPAPIQEKRIVDLETVRSATHQTSMLTQDENIVEVKFTAQYRVTDPKNYLFNVREPDATLLQAMKSAVREVVGKNKIDFVLSEGRPQISADTKTLMQKIMDDYKTGIFVTTVNLQQAQPPNQVQSAFFDAVKSREDSDRYVKEAESYRNTIVPAARGEAARIVQEANAYRDSIIAKAEGEADRFTKLLAEYVKAPEVTRERLYIEATESVLTRTAKVVVDVEGGNNLLYLPLDKLMQRGTGTDSTGTTNSSSRSTQTFGPANSSSRRPPQAPPPTSSGREPR